MSERELDLLRSILEVPASWILRSKMEHQIIRVPRDPSTGLGFGLGAGADGFPEVGVVVPNSPAARAGLRRGDKVARING